MARPLEYTQDLADKICEQLSQGISLRSVCKQDGMPSGVTVFRWLRTQEGFSKQYARAKEESTDAMAEEILDLSDGSVELALSADPKASGAVVQASRLQVDTRKWLMSKMKPKKYGDKMDLTTNGKDLPTPILPVTRPSVL